MVPNPPHGEQPLAICLMGPTASGKTDLAVDLVRHLPCDIISVDSALIYKDMDIGTAKPDRKTLEQAPHRLIDFLDPSESYSVARFYQDALREMQAINEAGRIPLLVGGTMMYFRILRDGIAAMPSADEAVREAINNDALAHGWSYVHKQLAEVDPDAARRIKPSDPQRLQRALEVYRVSGRTLTELWAEQAKGKVDVSKKMETGKAAKADYTNLDVGLPPVPFRLLSLAIAPATRSDLHERIALRFRQMLDADFVAEVEALYQRGDLSLELPSMRCVGYRQVWDYLEGRLNYEEMIERGIIATRQLAKRQLTWLRSWPNVHWLQTGDANNLDNALKYVKKAISNGA